MNSILFFAHGSRDPLWRAPFDAIVTEVRGMYVVRLTELAFLELMTPDFETAMRSLVAQGATQIRVVPLFLAQGTHVRNDLKALVETAQAAYPQVAITVAPAIGEVPAIRAAIASAVIAGL